MVGHCRGWVPYVACRAGVTYTLLEMAQCTIQQAKHHCHIIFKQANLQNELQLQRFTMPTAFNNDDAAAVSAAASLLVLLLLLLLFHLPPNKISRVAAETSGCGDYFLLEYFDV